MAKFSVPLQTAWGLQRAGVRIEATVNNAIRIVLENTQIKLKDDFLIVNESEVTIRNRLNVSSQSLRKPENISLDEIAIGVVRTISASFGATFEEIVSAISRMLGYKSTSAVLRSRIKNSIEILEKNKTVVLYDNLIKLADLH
nr:conserved hypothetical protein [Serratia symbiotica]